MFCERRRYAQTDIAGRADFERDLSVTQLGHQLRIFQASDTMADALRLQRSQRSPNAFGSGCFAGVWDCGESRRSRALESFSKEIRGISRFNSTHPERHDAAVHSAD